MLNDAPKPKGWEELAAEASAETDPEKLGTILEQILAALEERERNLTPPKNSAGS